MYLYIMFAIISITVFVVREEGKREGEESGGRGRGKEGGKRERERREL